MANVTYFVVLPFVSENDTGEQATRPTLFCKNCIQALRKIDRVAVNPGCSTFARLRTRFHGVMLRLPYVRD